MRSQAAPSSAPPGSARASHPANARPHGRWLLLARVGWVAVAGLALALFMGGLPAYVAEIESVCRTPVCTFDQLTPDALQQLHALGLSLDFFASYELVLNGLVVMVFVAVGLVIFWRKAADPTALVAAFALLTLSTSITDVTRALPAPWSLPAQVLNFLGSIATFLLFYVFPNGRFVPRWTRWLWAAAVIGFGSQDFFPSAPVTPLLGQGVLPGLAVSLAAVQIYRYRSVSTPVQRQQTKWIVFGITVAVVGYLTEMGLQLSFPGPLSNGTLLHHVVSLLEVSALLIPLSFGFAILRYRLWDVDVLINKALVYGLLIGLLGALYMGLIIGLESLVGRLGGTAAQNPVVLVVSTLAIAALFQSMRKRLQNLIDRRFYRQKYDAAKTLGVFSATLRQETDLGHLCAHLLAVVSETMQPACVSLWLRPLERHPNNQAHLLEPHLQVPFEPSKD